jgi:glutamate decarboxylase
MPLHKKVDDADREAELEINPVYVRELQLRVPRNRIPAHGMLPDTALQAVRDELILDGNARLNLATFVTTWMEPQAQQLMAECFDKNMIDKDEYPQTAELERRCVNILADLWHAPTVAAGTDGQAAASAVGCSTTGSSEACMLGGMALLWRWRARRTAAGAAATTPNLVMGANVRSLGAAAAAGLAGPGLHLSRGYAGHGGAPDRGQERPQYRPGRRPA